jgi:peptide/nickel transport system ATP-binding protein
VTALLEVDALSVGFRTRQGVVRALTGASLALDRGEILVVVGESGSGKTVLAHSLLRLLPRNVSMSGAIRLDGDDLLGRSERELRAVRGRRIALIPQSPASSLNPVRRLGGQLVQFARARGLGEEQAEQRLTELLDEVGLDFAALRRRYVHQLSGGMQQRVVNALALVASPQLVIADEPTSGLDAALVDVTADRLLAIAGRGVALLVITHDLRLARRLGGRLALLYAGRIVEEADTATFFAGPRHPYGRELLRALPEREGRPIPGLPPALTDLPDHCAFAARCPDRRAVCLQAAPDLSALPAGGAVMCHVHAER